MKKSYFLSPKTLSLTAAGLLGAGISSLPAQEVHEAPGTSAALNREAVGADTGVVAGTGEATDETTGSTGETAPLVR